MNGSVFLLHHTSGYGMPSTSQVRSRVNPEYVVYVLGRLTICAGAAITCRRQLYLKVYKDDKEGLRTHPLYP